jgi:hypothetical protein
MTKLAQIEAAIPALPARDRSRLARNLPKLFPEHNGDAAWERLLRDSRARPALSRLLDATALAVAEDATELPETNDANFKRRS